MIRRLRSRVGRALDRRFAHIETLLERERREREAGQAEIGDAVARLEPLVRDELRAMLRALSYDDAQNRRSLYALRASPDYDLAFSEATPLVTVAVATRADRRQLLLERALPSALAQTHPDVEVVVVGDSVGPTMRAAVEALGDRRIRFFDLTQRLVHPDPVRHSLTGAIMPRNEAHRLARGRWIADLDDDDALRPDAIERLVELARSERVEVAYGVLEQHAPGGATTLIGEFPPGAGDGDWKERGLPYQRWHGSASTGAIFHAGLRIFAREHFAAELGVPGDFFRLERMLRAGVSFAMLDRVTYDYYPATLWDGSR